MNFIFNFKPKPESIQMDLVTVETVEIKGGLFSLPVEIIDKILHYLSITDLLNSSLVSKAWYEYIGKSEKPMKKFILRYGQSKDYVSREKPKRQPKKKDAESIQKSKRNYQILQVTQCKRSDEVMFLPTKAWRKVQLNVGKFSSKLDYFRYVKNVFKILN